MTFRLSQRSLDRLDGVNEQLVGVVNRAISITKVDFGVICGLRTVAEQRALVESGASLTMKSKHLVGKAVDLMAYVGSRGSWELNLYDDIADAMAESALSLGVKIRWGAAWSVPDIAEWHDRGKSMEAAMNSYIDTRRSQGRRPWIDGPHFEIN